MNQETTKDIIEIKIALKGAISKTRLSTIKIPEL